MGERLDRTQEVAGSSPASSIARLIACHCSLTLIWEICVVRPLRYSINVTLDGCCDHRVISPDEEMHRHATKSIDQADALLFGRLTYEMMESAWRPPGQAEAMRYEPRR